MELEDLAKQIETNRTENNTEHKEIFKTLEEIQLTLQPTVTHEGRIRVLEDKETERKGQWKLLVFLGSIIGALSTLAVDLWLRRGLLLITCLTLTSCGFFKQALTAAPPPGTIPGTGTGSLYWLLYTVIGAGVTVFGAQKIRKRIRKKRQLKRLVG